MKKEELKHALLGEYNFYDGTSLASLLRCLISLDLIWDINNLEGMGEDKRLHLMELKDCIKRNRGYATQILKERIEEVLK